VIRFSAVLVVVAIGVLIGGIATSKLLLVYVAIGLSAAALVALAIGVVLKREELFSEQGQALAPAAAGAGADEPLFRTDSWILRIPPLLPEPWRPSGRRPALPRGLARTARAARHSASAATVRRHRPSPRRRPAGTGLAGRPGPRRRGGKGRHRPTGT